MFFKSFETKALLQINSRSKLMSPGRTEQVSSPCGFHSSREESCHVNTGLFRPEWSRPGIKSSVHVNVPLLPGREARLCTIALTNVKGRMKKHRYHSLQWFQQQQDLHIRAACWEMSHILACPQHHTTLHSRQAGFFLRSSLSQIQWSFCCGCCCWSAQAAQKGHEEKVNNVIHLQGQLYVAFGLDSLYKVFGIYLAPLSFRNALEDGVHLLLRQLLSQTCQ